MAKTPKRPRDPNQLAKLIADITTGDAADNDPSAGKDKTAAAMGSKGGSARAKSLTPDQRKAIAQKAAKSRWAKN